MSISLAAIKTALRLEDIEGLIELGAPEDEYDTEAKEIASAIAMLKSNELDEPHFVSIISLVWAKYFNLDGNDIGKRLEAFHRVARILLQNR